MKIGKKMIMRFLSFRKPKDTQNPPNILHSFLALLYALGNGVLGVLILFDLRIAVMTTVDRSSVRVWSITFIDIVLSVILCILLLTMIIVFQNLYEKDLAKSMIPKRFFLYTGIEVALFLAIMAYTRFVLLI